jgi:hypothetical protein
MPENSVELFEPDSVAARCEDVPLMELHLLDDAGAYSGTPYVSSYDAIYGEEPIEVRRTATGTYVVVEGHRGVLTARWLGIDPIPVVVLPENEG